MSGDARKRTLVIFAKEPRPGRVKTRLARSIGNRPAAELYRRMGRRIVDGLRGGPWRTVVRHAPDTAGDSIRGWLDPDGLEFAPQGPGDLGQRMSRAVHEALADGRRGALVCVVGTDAPDVDDLMVERAFQLLESGWDGVLGPAEDGGYYLIALAADRPELFRDIDWSTATVLDATRNRFHAHGLDFAELPELADVDELEDLERVGNDPPWKDAPQTG